MGVKGSDGVPVNKLEFFFNQMDKFGDNEDAKQSMQYRRRCKVCYVLKDEEKCTNYETIRGSKKRGKFLYYPCEWVNDKCTPNKRVNNKFNCTEEYEKRQDVEDTE